MLNKSQLEDKIKGLVLHLTIKKTNAKYQKASRLKRIVMISEDIVRMLERGIIQADKSLVICTSTESCIMDFDDEFKQLDIIQDSKLQNMSCTVCAKGAALVSKQRVGNSLHKERHVTSNELIEELLDDVFTREELDALEAVFELSCYSWTQGWANEVNYSKYKEFTDPTERLIAIYKDVIKNKGKINLELFS